MDRRKRMMMMTKKKTQEHRICSKNEARLSKIKQKKNVNQSLTQLAEWSKRVLRNEMRA